MGFGFNLFFLFILVPGSALLIILAILKQEKVFLKLLAVAWLGVSGLAMISVVGRSWFATIELEKEDYYGSYVIDRNQFSGRQADWQYNTFRFDITRDDKIIFYVTNKDDVLKTYTGEMSTIKPYSSHRPIFWMQQPTHHIVLSNPTVCRQGRQFYLVFDSPRFGNVFFKKGKWKLIDN